MGERYLIDSNVIIDYSANRLPQKGSDFAEKLFNEDFLISVIVKIEVLGFNDLPYKIKAMEEFVDTAQLLPLDESVTSMAINLRRSNGKLRLGDAIIAATALIHDMTLLSRNISDFQKIPDLKLLNVWDL